MAMNVTPFVGTDNFNMETFNNMISQINNGVNSEISEVLAQLGTKAKIQTGSYVGTGTYGADNPCSLTFDFEPTILWVYYMEKAFYTDMSETTIAKYIGSSMGFIIPNNSNSTEWDTTFSNINPTDSATFHYAFIDKQLTWYNTYNSTGGGGNTGTEQFNRKNCIYHWIAIA